MSNVTIFAALRVVPPDFIAPAERSPIFRKLINPELWPPPESDSPDPRIFEKLEPVPDPYLKILASLVHKSMIPPSFTRSSLTDWMKQAWGCGCSYAFVDFFNSPESGQQKECPCAGPEIPYAQCNPVLNHCGEFGAVICEASINDNSS